MGLPTNSNRHTDNAAILILKRNQLREEKSKPKGKGCENRRGKKKRTKGKKMEHSVGFFSFIRQF